MKKSIKLLLNGKYENDLVDDTPLAGCNFKLLEQDLCFQYYFIMDPIFFMNENDLTDSHKEKRARLFEKFSCLDQNFTLVVPRQFKNKFKRKFSNIHVDSIIFRSIPLISPWIDVLLVKLGFSLSSMNVIFAMLTYSLRNGFTSIYIYGANHNWINQISVNQNNVIIYTPNGYKTYESIPLKYHDGKLLNMSDFLNTQQKNFKTHDRFSKVSNILTTNILNMSNISYITSYKRSSN
jgi:hypothetical protein